MRRHEDRYSEAVEMVDGAEALVQLAEAGLVAARDPTMADVAETELRAALAMQDEVAEAVAPAIAAREQELRRQAHDVCGAMAGEPGVDWTLKRRRYFSPALKSRLIRKIGRRLYERIPL